jgi:DNA-directed RNA polymerase subunit RPC12/RpoP
LQLIIDTVKARCPVCGHDDFAPPPTPAAISSRNLCCARCGAETAYSEILLDIERQLVRSSAN